MNGLNRDVKHSMMPVYKESNFRVT